MTRNYCDTCGKEVKRAVMPDKGKEVYIYSIRDYDRVFCCRACFLDYMIDKTKADYELDFHVEKCRFNMATVEAST